MMPNNEIWVLGTKSSNADRSFLWTEDIPSLSDADILIIDITSLASEILDLGGSKTYVRPMAIDPKDRYVENMHNKIHTEISQIRSDLEYKLLVKGKIIIIYKHYEDLIVRDKMLPNMILPIHIQSHRTGKSTKMKRQKNHMYGDYLKNVKNFDYSISDVYDTHSLDEKTRSILSIRKDLDYEITDNSDRCIGGTFHIHTNVTLGDVTILPAPTEISNEDAVDMLVSIVKKDNNELPPQWVKKLEIHGLTELDKKVRLLEKNKEEIQHEIDIKTKEQEKLLGYYGLLFSQGRQLEKIVMDSFKRLGFAETRYGKLSNEEDLIIEPRSINEFAIGVIEVKGRYNKTTMADITQCEKWVTNYLIAKPSIKAKGIFISNQFRKKEYPASRNDRKKYEPNEIDYAESRKICIIPSYVLFEAVNKILEGKTPNRKIIEQLIFQTNGVVDSLL